MSEPGSAAGHGAGADASGGRGAAGAPGNGAAGASVAQHVHAALRERILRLDPPPGAPLTEQSVAATYDVSRNTVREALRLLEAEGLVRHHRHRGAVVTEPTLDELQDLFAARRAVETSAAAAVGRGASVDVATLRDHVVTMGEAAAAADGPGVVEADLGFHRTLVAAVGSRRLERFYASLQTELRLALVALDWARPDPGKAAQHDRLVELVVAGDGRALASALEEHLTAALADLGAVFDRDGAPWPSAGR